MHTLTPMAVATALTALFSGLAAPARADRDPDGEGIPPLPLTFKALEWNCPATCIAVAPASGRLLCLNGNEGLSCDDCEAAWVDPGQSRIAWRSLQSCGQMEPALHKGALAAINAEAAKLKARAVEPEFAPDTFTRVTEPHVHQVGELTFVLDSRTLRIMRKGTPEGELAWAPIGRALEKDEEVTIESFALGGGHLVAVFYKNPEFVRGETRWEMLSKQTPTPADATPLAPETGARAKCAPDANCPPDYDPIVPYMRHFCAQTLTDAELAGLRTQARRGELGKRELIALFNLRGAFHGYAFKAEKWLNAFYYGSGAWLPDECRRLIRASATEKDVPTAFATLRDKVKAIWSELP